MTAACYCDYDAPTLYTRRMVKSRKAHRCTECGCTIGHADAYERTEALWEGQFETYKTCARCCALRKWVLAHVPCFCWAHQNLLDGARETIDEYKHECPGLWFGWARQYVVIRRQATADRKVRQTARDGSKEMRQ